MLFAATFGDHLFYIGLLVVFFLGTAIKTIASIDDKGEVKKTANDGLARMIDRFLK